MARLLALAAGAAALLPGAAAQRRVRLCSGSIAGTPSCCTLSPCPWLDTLVLYAACLCALAAALLGVIAYKRMDRGEPTLCTPAGQLWTALLLNLICGAVVTIRATMYTDVEMWMLGLLLHGILGFTISLAYHRRVAGVCVPWGQPSPRGGICSHTLAAAAIPFCMIFLGVAVGDQEPDVEQARARALLWLVLACTAALVVAELWTLATTKEGDGGPTETIDNPTGSETSRTNARVEVVEVDEQGREMAGSQIVQQALNPTAIPIAKIVSLPSSSEEESEDG